MTRSVPAEVLEPLRAASSVLVIGHIRPDGDTSTSTLALGRALEALGKDVTRCLVDGVPGRVDFLPDVERVVRDPGAHAPYDVAVVVDAASYVRVGYPIREKALAPVIVNIDHHRTNERFGDVNWVDDGYPATAEMVLDLLDALGVALDPELASQIFAGIATDTGYFKYSATTPDTMRKIARLMEAGADPTELHRLLFDETSLGHQKLLGVAQARIETRAGGRVAWTHVTAAEGRELGVEGPLASLGVGPLTRLRGVELAVCFEARADGDVIAEFRSRGEIPVDELARELGGGGHVKASGCTLPGPLERVRPVILARLEAMLGDPPARAGAAGV